MQRWLQSHQDQFDPIATMPLEDAALRMMEVSSDSWTIETPERTSSSSSEGEASQQTQNDEGLKEVDWHGGGEWEGAPNNQDGGSRLVAPQKQRAVGKAPEARIRILRLIQANLAQYIGEEMQLVDVTNQDQGCYMEVLTEAIIQKLEAEETLLRADHDDRMIDQKEMEEEFLVTKTVSTKEVMEDFENWAPAITAEHGQLVTTKQAVEQITKEALRAHAAKEGKTIELIPAKMVYTRKAGTGTRRARAVCCGNYSETRFDGDCYAGGADGCQVRVLVRTAALKDWRIAATDIRVAFLNAPRREDGKYWSRWRSLLSIAAWVWPRRVKCGWCVWLCTGSPRLHGTGHNTETAPCRLSVGSG